MKQRIFNSGKGWYISASNYKDKDDKAYMNIHFAKCEEPLYQPVGGNDFVFTDIDILEQKYGAYKGKIQLTVFKYQFIESKGNLDEIQEENGKFADSLKGTEYAKKFGANVDLSPDDLPFY